MASDFHNEQLDNRVDLAVTTDYRNVLGEIVVRRLRNKKLENIFPDSRTTVRWIS